MAENECEKYFIIYDFMTEKLKLKGAQLLVYALVFGFCQNGRGVYDGSISYLAKRTGISKRSITNILKSLVEKQLLIKKEKYDNNIKFCTYEITSPPVQKFPYPMEKTSPGYGKNFTGGMEKTSPNNKDNNKEYIKDNNKGITPLGIYNNVYLSDEQFEKLKTSYPNDYMEKINYFSEYVEATGKKYSNHYLTIDMWAKRDEKNMKKEESPIKRLSSKPTYDLEKFKEYAYNNFEI